MAERDLKRLVINESLTTRKVEKKSKMNDKKKHLRRCFRIAAHEYKDFYHNNKR